MLKRLSFALVAISFTVPVVACLDKATDKAASSDANMLTDAEKTACNFGFDAVTPAANDEPKIVPVQDKGINISGRPFVFGDVNGDQKLDVLVVGAADKVTLFPGNGDGHFAKGIDTALAPAAGQTAKAIAVVGMGDFDGDGKKDAVLVQTVGIGTGVTRHLEAHYLVGYGKDDGTFELVDQGIKLVDGEASKKAQWHAVTDLDADGKDDLVYAGTKGEEVLFGGEADKKLKHVPTTIAADTKDRVLTFATADGLVVTTEEAVQIVKFAKADRAATITSKDGTFAAKMMAGATDLDADGHTELTVFNSGLDALVINPLSIDAAPSWFDGFKGSKVDYADVAIDLVGDPAKKNSQLLFRTDDRKLHAACGYAPTSTEIVAAELPIPTGKKVVVVGTPDLNHDGKTDIVTFDFDAKSLAVFLGGTPKANTPNPQVSYFLHGFKPEVDSGVDGSVTTDDAGDAGVDGDIVVVTDDGGVDADVDAGDGSVTTDTTSSSGSTSGSTSSGGETTSSGGSSSGGETTSSGGSSSGKTSSSSGGSSSGKSSSSSGSSGSSGAPEERAGASSSSSGNNAAPAASDDGGCSTTGTHESPTGSVALGLAVGLMLLGKRRRRQA